MKKKNNTTEKDSSLGEKLMKIYFTVIVSTIIFIVKMSLTIGVIEQFISNLKGILI